MFSTDLHRYTRALMGADAIRVGPFLVGFDAHDDGRYRNYAVPDDAVHPSSAEVDALVDAFVDCRRVPRLEYLPDRAPDLEAVLSGAGFVVEQRLPVMTCEPGEAVEPAVAGVRIRPAAETDLRAVAEVQNEAYGVPTTTEHDVDRLRRTLSRGGLVVLAETSSGEVVGAGICAPPQFGISELAGVGVRAPYRGRGIAAAVTAQLTRRGPEVGIRAPFLTPAGEAEERIYARVGYRRRVEMVHTSRPVE